MSFDPSLYVSLSCARTAGSVLIPTNLPLRK